MKKALLLVPLLISIVIGYSLFDSPETVQQTLSAQPSSLDKSIAEELAKKKSVLILSPEDLLIKANSERLKHGVAPVRLDARLNESSTNKATDMVVNNYYDHISPNTNKTAFQILLDSKVCKEAGENLSNGGSPSTAVEVWMTSNKGHREAILNPKFDVVGFSTIKANDSYGANINGTYYVVMHFCDLP